MHLVHLQNISVKLTYQGHQVKVKVTGTKSVRLVWLRLKGSLVNDTAKSADV